MIIRCGLTRRAVSKKAEPVGPGRDLLRTVRVRAPKRYNQSMDTELKQLEAKAARAVEQCDRLRAENQDLRQQLALRTDEVKRLTDKLDESRRRIEALLARMPG